MGKRKPGEKRKNMPLKGERHEHAKTGHNTTPCWVRSALFICFSYNGNTVSDKELTKFINGKGFARVHYQTLQSVRRYERWQDEVYFVLAHPLWPYERKLPMFFGSGSHQFRSEVRPGKYGWRKGIGTVPDERMWKWACDILEKMFRHSGISWEDRDSWVGPARDRSVTFERSFQPDEESRRKMDADKLRRLAYRKEASMRASDSTLADERPGPRTFEQNQAERVFDDKLKATIQPILDAADYLDDKKDALGNSPEEVERLIARKGERWYRGKLQIAEAALGRSVPELLNEIDQIERENNG